MSNIGVFTSDGFHQGAFTLEEYIESIKRLGDYTEEDIFVKYIRKQQEIRHLAECAKIYILKNYDKIQWGKQNYKEKEVDDERTS